MSQDPAKRSPADEAPEEPAAAETVMPTPEEIQALREDAARAPQLEEKLRRAQADFLNETKRIARSAEDARKFAVEGLVHDLLAVFDAFHRAREGLGDVAEDDPMRQGLDLVETDLIRILARHGVERIHALEATFDPNAHEALAVIPHGDLPPNTVSRVLRPGFTLHGRVVRPAHVHVTPSASQSEANAGGTGEEG